MDIQGYFTTKGLLLAAKLAAGSTLEPAELAKLAGIDITTDAPLLNAIAYIGELIDEIGKLTEELGR